MVETHNQNIRRFPLEINHLLNYNFFNTKTNTNPLKIMTKKLKLASVEKE